MQPVVFPGRQTVLDRFQQVLASGKLSQTYLFVGPEGVGKEATALEIARLANCPREPACTDRPLCESCQKAATFQHPDIRWIGPAPASIGVDELRELLIRKQENPFYQPAFAATANVTIGDPEDPGPVSVRSLLRFLRRQAFQGQYKVAVVADSHRLTAGAANSLLKTLEEPPPRSLFFLLTTNRSALLPTIVSRCQQVRFDLYQEEELVSLLVDRDLASPDEAELVCRVADGNARKALALLEPQARALQNWARKIFGWIHEGRAGSAQAAADSLHNGAIPAEMVPADADQKVPDAKDSPGKRERAIQLCEMLNLYYSELLMCRARGEAWVPRLAAAADELGELARERTSATLLRDLEQIEAAKVEIDRNLNIGLSLAFLFQGLINNVEKDKGSSVRRA